MTEKPINDEVKKDFDETIKRFYKASKEFNEVANQLPHNRKADRAVDALENINRQLGWICYLLFILCGIQFNGCIWQTF